MINIMGNDEQKAFVFNEILNGKRLANGEPERNTKDTKTLETTLTIEDGRYFVNGVKFYSTGSYFADWLAIKAVHPEGYVVLTLVDRNAEGVEVIDDWNGFGQRTTSSGTVKIHNVEVNPLLILMSVYWGINRITVAHFHNSCRLRLMSGLPKLLFKTL